MSGSGPGPSLIPAEALHDALERVLRDRFGREAKIGRLARRVSPYSSSFLIEELDVVLRDGTTLEMIFKNLSDSALLEDARKIKPRMFHDPLREIETCRVLSTRRPSLGVAAFYGAFAEPATERYWLFLERLPSTLLWQEGGMEAWKSAASWLAALHGAGTELLETGLGTRLIHHDRSFFELWMQRARAFVSRNDSTRNRKASTAVEWLAGKYEKAIERLVTLPGTFIHGEFYASNVLIDHRGSGLRVCPVDWEMAAFGPGLADLAALTAGEWTVEQRALMAEAYRAHAPARLVSADAETFRLDLEYCRLHQAVQWLGWSPEWAPPLAHEQDWLKQAVTIAEDLKL